MKNLSNIIAIDICHKKTELNSRRLMLMDTLQLHPLQPGRED